MVRVSSLTILGALFLITVRLRRVKKRPIPHVLICSAFLVIRHLVPFCRRSTRQLNSGSFLLKIGVMEPDKQTRVDHAEAVSVVEDKVKNPNDELDQPFTEEEERRVLRK